MEKGLLAELLRAGGGSLVGYRGKGRQVSHLISYLQCLLEHSVLTGARAQLRTIPGS